MHYALNSCNLVTSPLLLFFFFFVSRTVIIVSYCSFTTQANTTIIIIIFFLQLNLRAIEKEKIIASFCNHRNRHVEVGKKIRKCCDMIEAEGRALEYMIWYSSSSCSHLLFEVDFWLQMHDRCFDHRLQTSLPYQSGHDRG